MTLKIGQEHAGGFIVDLDDSGTHGLVAAQTDLSKEATWKEAINLCAEYKVDNFDDWYLPSKEELDLVYQNLKKRGLGSFSVNNDDYYWSSTEDDTNYAWEQTFYDGYQGCEKKNSLNHVRAVRAF
ncbi:MAG: hypothetical protein ACI8P3_004624 [Saprospiraceae bacterium]|jgi:hypothetical protein